MQGVLHYADYLTSLEQLKFDLFDLILAKVVTFLSNKHYEQYHLIHILMRLDLYPNNFKFAKLSYKCVSSPPPTPIQLWLKKNNTN